MYLPVNLVLLYYNVLVSQVVHTLIYLTYLPPLYYENKPDYRTIEELIIITPTAAAE